MGNTRTKVQYNLFELDCASSDVLGELKCQATFGEDLFETSKVYIYIYIYMCVYFCIKEREIDRNENTLPKNEPKGKSIKQNKHTDGNLNKEVQEVSMEKMRIGWARRGNAKG